MLEGFCDDLDRRLMLMAECAAPGTAVASPETEVEQQLRESRVVASRGIPSTAVVGRMRLDSTLVAVEVLTEPSAAPPTRCEAVVVDVLASDLSHAITVAGGC
jgi:hypothetical protein